MRARPPIFVIGRDDHDFALVRTRLAKTRGIRHHGTESPSSRVP